MKKKKLKRNTAQAERRKLLSEFLFPCAVFFYYPIYLWIFHFVIPFSSKLFTHSNKECVYRKRARMFAWRMVNMGRQRKRTHANISRLPWPDLRQLHFACTGTDVYFQPPPLPPFILWYSLTLFRSTKIMRANIVQRRKIFSALHGGGSDGTP